MNLALLAVLMQHVRDERKWKPMRDPMTEDTAVLDDAAEEQARNERWNEFRDFVVQARTPTLLRHVADLMEDIVDPYYVGTTVQETIVGFQETEGWSGVLQVMASHLYEQERAANER